MKNRKFFLLLTLSTACFSGFRQDALAELPAFMQQADREIMELIGYMRSLAPFEGFISDDSYNSVESETFCAESWEEGYQTDGVIEMGQALRPNNRLAQFFLSIAAVDLMPKSEQRMATSYSGSSTTTRTSTPVSTISERPARFLGLNMPWNKREIRTRMATSESTSTSFSVINVPYQVENEERAKLWDQIYRKFESFRAWIDYYKKGSLLSDYTAIIEDIGNRLDEGDFSCVPIKIRVVRRSQEEIQEEKNRLQREREWQEHNWRMRQRGWIVPP